MEKLSEIAVPTMIFVGEEDAFFREPSEMMAQAIPGAQLRVIPSVGHSPQEEAPYTFNRELAGFLANMPQK
jgi:pimeloyl-ACP methyl ester carboxylesterase